MSLKETLNCCNPHTLATGFENVSLKGSKIPIWGLGFRARKNEDTAGCASRLEIQFRPILDF